MRLIAHLPARVLPRLFTRPLGQPLAAPLAHALTSPRAPSAVRPTTAPLAVTLALALTLAGCASPPAAPTATAVHTVPEPAPPAPAPAARANAEPAPDAVQVQPITARAAALAAQALPPIEVAITPPAVPGSVAYAERTDVLAWADAVAARTKLPLEWLRAALAEARYQPAVAKAILPAPAGTPKNWSAYRARFIEPRRIRAGLAFWQANEAALARAEREYGVPAEVIVGIIGVETLYGEHTGRFRLVDALATLAFDYPREAPRDRSAYFRTELEQYFELVRDIRANPIEIQGSYAGALGLPQFMPSSWRRHAVDFDGDGRIDLLRSPADAIGSVAHYLAEYGWQPGQPIYYPVNALPNDAAELARLLQPDIVPSFTAAELARSGVTLGVAPDTVAPGLLALVKLENAALPPAYVVGTDNFYVLTRYNQSAMYALAVTQLGEAVARERARAAESATK